MNDYGTIYGSQKEKKTYVFISLFTWTFTVLQTSVKARPVRRGSLCFLFSFFFNAFPQRLLPKQKRSVNMGREAISIYSTEGWGARFWGGPPPPPISLPAGFGVTLRPSRSALWPVFRWDSSSGGGGVVCPWCINQKALLARVFSSVLFLFIQNALEDDLADWVCGRGWGSSVSCSGTSLMLAVLEPYLENVAPPPPPSLHENGCIW